MLYVMNAVPQDTFAKIADSINAVSVIIIGLNIPPTIVLIIMMDLITLDLPTTTTPPMVMMTASMVMENSSFEVKNWYFDS